MKSDIFKKWSSYGILFGLVLLIFSPIYYLNSYNKTGTDFPGHAFFTRLLMENGIESLPAYIIAHSAWQYLLVFVNWMTGFTFEKISFLMVVLSAEITSLVLFLWFWPVFINQRIPLWRSLAIILGVSLATPVSVLWLLDGHMYLGYIGIATYHNPTIILLKPFALLQMIAAYKCFDNSTPLKNRQIIGAAVISLIGTYVKPSLAICILPALGIFAVYRLTQKKYVNLVGLFFGIAMPSVLLLIWQFLLSYYANDTGSVMFSPLGVMSIYSNYLFLKLVLSILFPLLVLIIHYEQVKLDDRLVIAWLVFGFGALYTYFFAEGGPRMTDGNFGWSGEIALVLLFTVSTMFYLEIQKKQFLTDFLIQASWILHVVFGIAYYFVCMFYTYI